MFEVLIVLILAVPIFLVVFILNRSRKKQKKAEQEKLAAYITPLLQLEKITPAYQKQLVYQHLTVDEKEGKLLLVNWKDFDFSHELHFLADVQALTVQTIKQQIADDEGGKPETFTAQIGIEMTLQKTAEKRFLTFYSHLDHNVYLISESTEEAKQLCERLRKLKAGKLLNA